MRAVHDLIESMKTGKTRFFISISTVSTVMVIFAGFLLVSHNLNLGIGRFRSASKIEVILKEDASGIAVASEAGKIPGVDGTRLYTKQEALEYFAEEKGKTLADGIVEALGFNPFPSFLEVRLAGGIVDPAPIAEQLQAIAGVDEVLYGKETADRLSYLARMVDRLTWATGGIISFCLLLIVVNSVRVSIHAREQEMFVLRLIGATQSYIRVPYLLEGAFLGALGTGIGLGVLYAIFIFVQQGIPYMQFSWLTIEMMIGIKLYAVALGLLGSVIATRETLRD